MRGLFLLWLVFASFGLAAQVDTASRRQGYDFKQTLINDVQEPGWNMNLDTIKPPAKYENIYTRFLYSDMVRATSFVIFIKKEVKEHKHETHAEHILVLEGEGKMTIDDKSIWIKKGDFILVPHSTWHSVKVTSKTPLKVLSIQAPHFDGKDRIFKENK